MTLAFSDYNIDDSLLSARCPKCHGHNIIIKTIYKDTDKYICDECGYFEIWDTKNWRKNNGNTINE